MFNIFKKKSKGLDSKQRAHEVIRVVSQTTEDWERNTTQFLIDHPEFALQKNKIFDEIQWIPYVSAFTSILATSNFKTANDSIKSLADILSTSMIDGEPFSETKIKEISNRLNAYLVRFNRSLVLNNGINANDEGLMNTLSDAIFDCANEGIYYFTNTKRDPHKIAANTYALEKRVPFGVLEIHVRETLMKYFMAFAEHFQKLGYE